MTNHTATDYHDPAMAIPGHNSTLVYVHETKVTGLHCEDCRWYGGSFKGRWAEKHTAEAWQAHVEFVQAGGVIEHGIAANVDAGTCKCVSCMIPWRMARTATQAAR